MDVILFLIFAVIAVVCGINVVVQTHPISSAVSLIGVMGSLAVLYLLLGAEFLAAAQVIVYAGAIMVLFVFIIMLLNAGEEERTAISRAATWLGVPFAVVLTAVLGWRIALTQPGASMAPGADIPGTSRVLSRLLFTSYVFPFELTSILILVAILGAVVLAKRDF
jgi:NADH-quinone oxidoreductase subunit J